MPENMDDLIDHLAVSEGHRLEEMKATKCLCGSTLPLEPEAGICNGRYGVFDRCPMCSRPFNFCEIKE